MAYFELSIGVGVTTGPILSDLIEHIFNSTAIVFFFFATIYAIYAFPIIHFLPRDQ